MVGMGTFGETGTSALEVMVQAMKEVLPYALRLYHPRSFAFVSSSPTWYTG